MAPLPRRTLLLAVAASFVTSAVWVALAWRTPTSTFHFAPLIAGAIGQYAAKSVAGPLALWHAIRVTGAVAGVVALAISLLLASDRLRGPTFWSSDGAGLEAALFAGLGLVLGLGYLVAGEPVTKSTVSDENDVPAATDSVTTE